MINQKSVDYLLLYIDLPIIVINEHTFLLLFFLFCHVCSFIKNLLNRAIGVKSVADPGFLVRGVDLVGAQMATRRFCMLKRKNRDRCNRGIPGVYQGYVLADENRSQIVSWVKFSL